MNKSEIYVNEQLPNEIIQMILEKTLVTKNIPLVCKSFNDNYNKVIYDFFSYSMKTLKQKIRNNEYDWEFIVPLIFKMKSEWRIIKLLKLIKYYSRKTSASFCFFRSLDETIEEKAIEYYHNNNQRMFYKLLMIVTPNKNYFFNSKDSIGMLATHIFDMNNIYMIRHGYIYDNTYIYKNEFYDLIRGYIYKYYSYNINNTNEWEIITDIKNLICIEYEIYCVDTDKEYVKFKYGINEN